jgi:hypothetical protein
VKITRVPETIRSTERVNDKENASGQGRGQNREERNPEQQKEPETFQITEVKVENAVDAFQKDDQARVSGLQASMIGQGPGLRVILKDGSGAIVRQFTGEEFVKLREAVSKDGRARGKILDQKL